MGTLLASFPNSRIKPRPATTQSQTFSVSAINAATTLIIAPNPNRANLTIRNTGSDDVYYGYVTPLTALTGFLLKGLDSVDIQDPRSVYVFNGNAAPILIDVDEGEG